MNQEKNKSFQYSFYYGFAFVAILFMLVFFFVYGAIYSTFFKDRPRSNSEQFVEVQIDTVYIPCEKTHCQEVEQDSTKNKKK